MIRRHQRRRVVAATRIVDRLGRNADAGDHRRPGVEVLDGSGETHGAQYGRLRGGASRSQRYDAFCVAPLGTE